MIGLAQVAIGKVHLKSLGVQGAAGGLLEQFIGRMERAPGMHVLAQPADKRRSFH